MTETCNTKRLVYALFVSSNYYHITAASCTGKASCLKPALIVNALCDTHNSKLPLLEHFMWDGQLYKQAVMYIV